MSFPQVFKITQTSKKAEDIVNDEDDSDTEDEEEEMAEDAAAMGEIHEEEWETDDGSSEGEEIEEYEEEEIIDDEEYNGDDEGNWSDDEKWDKVSGQIDEEDEELDDESSDAWSCDSKYVSKLEKQERKDKKRPDFIDGMKVLKVEYTPQLTYEEDTALQTIMDPNREEPESDEEDYAMGTTNRIKVKGGVLLSAEMIHDKFVSEKKELAGLNIVKEKRAEIRKKKIVLVDKNKEETIDTQKEIDDEILKQEREERIEKIKGLKRRGEKLTKEEKKERKEV